MKLLFFKEWFNLNEGRFEDQSLSILNKDEELFNLIASKAPEPKYLPIISYFYKQSGNLNILKDLIDKYKEFVDKNKLPMIQITNKGAFLNNQEINYVKFAEIIHAAESNNKIVKTNIAINTSGLKPVFAIKDKIEIYKAKNSRECVLLGKGYPFCISNPNAGLNMWNTYRNSYESTFYFVLEKTRGQDDPLRIVVVDAQRNGDFALTDANNTTGTISEFRHSDEYFGYLHSAYNVNCDSVFINEPLTQQERTDNSLVDQKIMTLDSFKKLTLAQKEKYIGNGHELTNEQFDYIVNANMVNFIIQYINTGIKLDNYQLKEIFKNPSYKKTYLRQRLAVQEHLHRPNIGRFEYLNLDEQSKSQIDLNKIDKKDWFLDAAYLGDEEYIKNNKQDDAGTLTSAYMEAVKSRNLNVVKIIDEKFDKFHALNTTAVGWIFDDITKHSTVEILDYFVKKHNKHYNVGLGFQNVAKRNEVSMVRYFIDNFEMKGLAYIMALYEAVKSNAIDSLNVILDNPELENEHNALDTAMSIAAEHGNLKIANLILNKHKVNFYNAVLNAIEHKQYQFLEFIFKARKDFPEKWLIDFLKNAIKTKSLPIFKLILNQSSDPQKLLSHNLLDYIENYKEDNDELYEFIKKKDFEHYFNAGIHIAKSSDINSKPKDEIKYLLNFIRDRGVGDFSEIRNAAKETGNMNIYDILSKAPFLRSNYE